MCCEVFEDNSLALTGRPLRLILYSPSKEHLHTKSPLSSQQRHCVGPSLLPGWPSVEGDFPLRLFHYGFQEGDYLLPLSTTDLLGTWHGQAILHRSYSTWLAAELCQHHKVLIVRRAGKFVCNEAYCAYGSDTVFFYLWIASSDSVISSMSYIRQLTYATTWTLNA